MKFWKFEGRESAEIQALRVSGGAPSEGSCAPGCTNTNATVLTRVREGDGLLLAHLDGGDACIVGLGLVRAVQRGHGPTSVEWVEHSATVSPNPQGGLANWRQKSAFEISADPAKRYGLRQMFRKRFADVV